MFEAIVTLCLALSGGACHDQLVPGYEAATAQACAARLEASAPDLPETARDLHCQPAGPTLAVTETAPGVFVHEGRIEEPDATNRGDVANLGFVIGAESVAVIDTGSARWLGEGLWRAIRTRTDLPVSHVILTHMHPDHVFGAGPFAEAGAVIVGHARLPRALADRQVNYQESLSRLIGDAFAGSRTVAVTMTVEDATTLDLGARILELQAWDVAHTGTDVTVLDRATGTLFAGDLVFDRHTPALDGQLRGWRRILERMAGLDASHVVPGHGGPVLDWPEGAADTARYLEVLEQDTRAAIERGDRLGEAVQVIGAQEAGSWQLFDAYNARNATVAFTELEWE